MNMKEQMELGKKARKAIALMESGYSNRKIAGQLDFPEELVNALFNYLKEKGEL